MPKHSREEDSREEDSRAWFGVNNAQSLRQKELNEQGLPIQKRGRRGEKEEEDIKVLSSAVVLLTSNNVDDITNAITGQPELRSSGSSVFSSLSVASKQSISTISSAPSNTNDGIRNRLTAFFSESLTLNAAEYPRAAALRTLISKSFNVTAASLRSMLSSSASDGRALLEKSRDFITGTYTSVLRPYLQSVSEQLKSLKPGQTYDAIYVLSNNMRAAILACRHLFTVFGYTAPIARSIFVTLGTFLYNAGDVFITWLQSNQPEWLTNFMEMLYEAGSAILQVSMDDALGMGDSSEVVPVLVVIVTVLVVLDKFGPGLGDRFQAFLTKAYTKIVDVGQYLITKVGSLGERGYNLAIRFWNSTRQIREYYTRGVGLLHIPYYIVATITTMSARALYLGFISLYGLGEKTTGGLKLMGERKAVERAAGILEGLKALDTLEFRAKRLERTQDVSVMEECLEIKTDAERLVEELLAEAERLEAERLEAARLEAEGGGTAMNGGARKSKSRRRRRGPTVNKKQKKSRRYKRSNNRGGSRKNKKATKKRRN